MINEKRMMSSLFPIAEIGRKKGEGITRLGFSKQYFEALDLLEKLAEKRNLKTVRDRVSNLYIIYNPYGMKKFIMTGSHLDTVKNGGLYDGPLGIFAGLEVIESLEENNIKLDFGIIIACFNAEESSVVGGTLGSRIACKNIPYEDEEFIKKLEVYDINIEDIKNSALDFSDILSYIELHIEQGAVLYKNNQDIAAVDAIVAITRFDIEIKGSANHAGTTPMDDRDDPVRKLPNVLNMLYSLAQKYTSPFVMTVGDISVRPGMYNIIPSDIKLMVEVRDTNHENIQDYIENVNSNLEKMNIRYSMKMVLDKPAAFMDETIISSVQEAAKKLGYSYRKMSSGAGHDAAQISKKIPSGMIFVPSVDGKSHCKEEFTTIEQAKKGAEVLFETIMILNDKYKESL